MVTGAAADLDPEVLEEELGARPVRSYPAVVSTHADAMAWARAGAPSGALVVSDYQAAPRGRAGLVWEVTPGQGLGFSLVVHPELPMSQAGWVYVAASVALANVAEDETPAGVDVRTQWPDEVAAEGTRWAAIGTHSEIGAPTMVWGVVTVLITQAGPPRGPLLARVVDAIEDRLGAPRREVIPRYREICATLGERVAARLIPMGPNGTVIEGEAVAVNEDGALVIATDDDRRLAVRPDHLGILEVE